MAYEIKNQYSTSQKSIYDTGGATVSVHIWDALLNKQFAGQLWAEAPHMNVNLPVGTVQSSPPTITALVEIKMSIASVELRCLSFLTVTV
jgi:hypothetical protein